jgi:hypothetical protein
MSRDVMYLVGLRTGNRLGPVPLPAVNYIVHATVIELRMPNDEIRFIELDSKILIEPCESESHRDYWKRAAVFFGYSDAIQDME